MGLLPINVCMWEEALKREKQCWHKNSTSNLENKILSNFFKQELCNSCTFFFTRQWEASKLKLH